MKEEAGDGGVVDIRRFMCLGHDGDGNDEEQAGQEVSDKQARSRRHADWSCRYLSSIT